MTLMTNYSVPLMAALLGCAAMAAGPAAPQPATPAAATAPTGATRYTQAGTGSSLDFSFTQADALNEGSFRRFSTELTWDEKNPAAGRLKVTVQVDSLDTRDQDRDDTLRGADLLDTARYPQAQYLADSFARRADGKFEAVGKLTLRGVTRELRLPLSLEPTAAGLELSGETSIRRLDYGVGQGEWKSAEWVGDDVKLKYRVALARAR